MNLAILTYSIEVLKQEREKQMHERGRMGRKVIQDAKKGKRNIEGRAQKLISRKKDNDGTESHPGGAWKTVITVPKACRARVTPPLEMRNGYVLLTAPAGSSAEAPALEEETQGRDTRWSW